MIARLDISNFIKNVKEVMIPTILQTLGEQGTSWASQNLTSGYSAKNSDRTGNLENSLGWATAESQSVPLFGESLERPPKGVVRIGSKLIYAALHELGGRLTAKKTLGSVSRKQDVWAMEQFFWKKFYLTKDVKWKAMALYISKMGYIDQAARPYLRPIIQNKGQAIIDIVQKAVNG